VADRLAAPRHGRTIKGYLFLAKSPCMVCGSTRDRPRALHPFLPMPTLFGSVPVPVLVPAFEGRTPGRIACLDPTNYRVAIRNDRLRTTPRGYRPRWTGRATPMFDLHPITTADLLVFIQIIVIAIGFIFSWRSLEAANGSLDATRQSVHIAAENLKAAKGSLDATQQSVGIAAESLKAATESVKVAIENLKISTSNAQAQLYNEMVIQGRELQYKFMDIYHGTGQQNDLQANQDHYNGLVIAYYAACFELTNVFSLPDTVRKLLAHDLRELLRNEPIKRKWEQIRGNFSRKFIAYVNSLEGV
jgi:hypothetical protein